jgi:tol-pal system protein YbgF
MRIPAIRLAGGLLFAGALVIAAVAPAGDRAMAQGAWTGSSSKEDLLYRLQILDAEIADIRARLGGLDTGRPGAGGAASGDAAVLDAEIRRLTAQVERIEQAQRQMAAELTRRLGDIEYRLNEIEGVPNDGTGPPPIGAEVLTEPQAAPAPSVAVSERGDLDLAIRDVQQGRFDQAEDRLRRFMNDYPGSPLIGEAWYWLGESLFVRGIHAEAAKSYLAGYNTDRQGGHAAQNLFRLGVTLGRLGQVNEACLTLREVRSQFPNAPDDIPAKADAEADALSCG